MVKEILPHKRLNQLLLSFLALGMIYCHINFIRSSHEIDVIFHKKIKTKFYLSILRCIIVLILLLKVLKYLI